MKKRQAFYNAIGGEKGPIRGPLKSGETLSEEEKARGKETGLPAEREGILHGSRLRGMKERGNVQERGTTLLGGPQKSLRPAKKHTNSKEKVVLSIRKTFRQEKKILGYRGGKKGNGEGSSVEQKRRWSCENKGGGGNCSLATRKRETVYGKGRSMRKEYDGKMTTAKKGFRVKGDGFEETSVRKERV